MIYCYKQITIMCNIDVGFIDLNMIVDKNKHICAYTMCLHKWKINTLHFGKISGQDVQMMKGVREIQLTVVEND